jgi:hypothetical protein
MAAAVQATPAKNDEVEEFIVLPMVWWIGMQIDDDAK